MGVFDEVPIPIGFPVQLPRRRIGNLGRGAPVRSRDVRAMNRGRKISEKVSPKISLVGGSYGVTIPDWCILFSRDALATCYPDEFLGFRFLRRGRAR